MNSSTQLEVFSSQKVTSEKTPKFCANGSISTSSTQIRSDLIKHLGITYFSEHLGDAGAPMHPTRELWNKKFKKHQL